VDDIFAGEKIIVKGLNKKVSLARALSKMGVVSRKQARALIEAGRVFVNERCLTNPEVRVDPDREVIRVDRQTIQAAKPVYLMMHKPTDVVTTRSDERGRKTVYDLMGKEGWVFPVGRLDRETSGLLLLTNDTQWGNRIVAPESKIPKVYHVKLNRLMVDDDLKRLSRGMLLEEGVQTRPAEAKLLRQTEKSCWIEMTLQEGRNRQIRRMCEALGYRVERLVRVQIGSLLLGDLPSGATRPLTPAEVRRLAPPSALKRRKADEEKS
jgi:23S rRNA pseudouridine2605 synthase